MVKEVNINHTLDRIDHKAAVVEVKEVKEVNIDHTLDCIDHRMAEEVNKVYINHTLVRIDHRVDCIGHMVVVAMEVNTNRKVLYTIHILGHINRYKY